MKIRDTTYQYIKATCLLILLCFSLCISSLHAQESCYEQYIREHNMTYLTAEDADDSYDEQKKAVLAKQMYGNRYMLWIDTISGKAQIGRGDGTYVADVHFALVDSTWYMWLSVDPLTDKYPNSTPYIYCSGNPVMFIDPDGRYIEATDNGDGTYIIQKGENNRDRNVYVIDDSGERTGAVLGKMMTRNSFFDDNGTIVKGAMIDMNSREGQAFFDALIRQSPDLLSYITHATENGMYDFKNIGSEGLTKKELLQYHYRGSVSVDGRIVSARDWGNVGAGWIAGKTGLSWPIARIGFDGYQTIQASQSKGWTNIIWQREGVPTRSAEWEGYKIGIQQLLSWMIYGK